jgi:hypothetical protein
MTSQQCSVGDCTLQHLCNRQSHLGLAGQQGGQLVTEEAGHLVNSTIVVHTDEEQLRPGRFVLVRSQTSDQQTARLRHLLDESTAMLWSIQYNRRGTAQARHLHVTVSQGLGGPTAQVACMARHICIIHYSQ